MRKTVEAGQSVVVPLFNRWNAGVMVHPDFGATALVEFTFSSKDDVAADAAKAAAGSSDADSCMWNDWAAGAVTQKWSDVFDAQVSAVRLSSQGAASTFEVRG